MLPEEELSSAIFIVCIESIITISGFSAEISSHEASQKAYSGKGGQEDDDSVNLNTADLEELKTLPGIGDAKAKSIINYREEHGGFENIEEIMQIEGIKEGVFQKIKDKIKV